MTYSRSEGIDGCPSYHRYGVHFEGKYLGWVVTWKRNDWQSYRNVLGAISGQPTGASQYTRRDATMALLRAYGSFLG